MLFERSKDAPSRHPGFVSSPAAARVSGGMSRLPDALLAKLKPERIQTGLQVKHIEQQNGTLNICGSYADGRPFSLQAQHVLLALPPMLAAGINFFPRCPRRYCRHGVTPEPGWPPMQSMSLCIPIIFGTGRDYPER